MKSVRRLYEQFQPEHYDLHIIPDNKNMTFTGTVTVRGRKAGRPSERITFHQKDLTVTAATITRHDKKGDQEFPVSRINAQASYDEVRVHSNTMLYPGDYTITLAFSGTITPGMTGLYPCYFNVDNIEHNLLATQFESHHAREVFPCIDEPEAKATFDLSLTTMKNLTVLGNTPVKGTKEIAEEGLVTTIFETTPRMSSYLLAFVIGELHKKSTKTKRGTEVSVWATITQPADSLDFALDVAQKSIEFFEDYFGVPYPLAKSDHVALPDFSSGAMENWGLITYRERVLLAYPGESSQSIKETIALVVAHETSHQWFGNLVTMRWWNDLWLNESFANMMEYQAVDSMFPEWHIWDTFVASEGLSALRRDATPGVQAVKTDVNHPDEISALFDPSIVYAKGGRLLYMLKNYIGEDAFRAGLSAYFKTHAYKNTEGADLWAALGKASGIDVAAFMDPWLERSGFPMLTVSQTGTKLTIEQQHFSDNPAKADTERLWPVPLFATSTEVPARLDKQTNSVELPSDAMTLVNSGARGHYIVRYTGADQKDFIGQKIESKQLSNAERLIILNDASMLARAGHQGYGDVLQLLSKYSAETSEPVWDIMALIIGETRRFIDVDPSLEPSIKQLIRTLIAEEYARLGWEEDPNEPADDQKLRALIIGLGAYADEPAITDHALKLFEAFKDKQTPLSAEIRGIIFGVPVKQQHPQAFEYLIELHDTTQNSDLKSDIASALTIVRTDKEASILLGRLKDTSKVKAQDADRWLASMLRNRYVRATAWQWMEDNWDWIEKTYKNDKSYDYMPRYAAAGCNTPEWADRYKAFFKPKEDQVILKRNIQIGIEEIDNRIAWLKRDLAAVQKFFKPRG
jgi:aminopeptidase N